MRRLFTVSALIVGVLTYIALSTTVGLAQPKLPEPPVGFQPLPPPPPAPVKPYDSVAVKPPAPFNDPSFVAFRKNLSDIAQHKDRAALGKLTVAKGFFWLQDRDLADPSKPAIDNLAKAIGLDAPNGDGWDIVAQAAEEPTAAPQREGILCAPAPPSFDPQAFTNLLRATGTESDATEWGYPVDNGIEVRGAAQPNAPVVDKLGLYFVRVIPDGAGAPLFLHVALPNGKSGFVAATAIMPLATDQICYTKDASGWKIAGYEGGAQP
jgi:hypothetical protein